MPFKQIYILDYFVPNTDGGLMTVIAGSDDECFDLIVQWDNESWPEHYPKLRENILRSLKFPLLNDEESRVVETFIA